MFTLIPVHDDTADEDYEEVSVSCDSVVCDGVTVISFTTFMYV